LEYVDKYRHKYSPPEMLGNSGILDIKIDIWSFGCILIDIFSKENPIYRINITKNEIISGKKFPVIPKDITGLLRDIISRCLDTNYETRINIFELDNIMTVFFDNNNKTNNAELEKRISIKSLYLVNNKELRDMNEYIDGLDSRITSISKAITEDFQENAQLMKRQMISINEDINAKINDNYSMIKVQLQEIVHKKFEFLNLFYDKIHENVMLMQQSNGECMSDNIEGNNNC
jgi:serine/threonine protein kinase